MAGARSRNLVAALALKKQMPSPGQDGGAIAGGSFLLYGAVPHLYLPPPLPSPQAEGVDLLVVGSRGMGAVARSLLGLVGMGSVSDHLAHHSSSPLLVVQGVAGHGGDGLSDPDLTPGGPGGTVQSMSSTLRPITEGDGSEASSMQ